MNKYLMKYYDFRKQLNIILELASYEYVNNIIK